MTDGMTNFACKSAMLGANFGFQTTLSLRISRPESANYRFDLSLNIDKTDIWTLRKRNYQVHTLYNLLL